MGFSVIILIEESPGGQEYVAAYNLSCHIGGYSNNRVTIWIWFSCQNNIRIRLCYEYSREKRKGHLGHRFPFLFANKEIAGAEFIKKYHQIFDRKTQKCFAGAKPINDYEAYLEAVKLTK